MDNKKFVIVNKKDFIIKHIKFDIKIEEKIRKEIFKSLMNIKIYGYTEKDQIMYIQGYVEGYFKAYLCLKSSKIL